MTDSKYATPTKDQLKDHFKPHHEASGLKDALDKNL